MPLYGDVAFTSDELPTTTDRGVDFQAQYPILDTKVRSLESSLPDFAADAEARGQAKLGTFENLQGAREKRDAAHKAHTRVDAAGDVHFDSEHPDVVRADKLYADAREDDTHALVMSRIAHAVKADQESLVANVRHLLNDYSARGIEPEFYPAPKPRVGHVLDNVAAIEAERVETAAKFKEAENAPRTMDENIADAIADLDRQRAEAMPGVSLRRERVRVTWPVKAIGGAAGTDGSSPYATNPLPLLIHLAYDELVEHIKAEVAGRYKEGGVTPISDADRVETLAKLKAKVDLLEREEAAAVWAAREAGHRVPFRKGISAKAVLGLA